MPPFSAAKIAIGMPVGSDTVHWKTMASLLELEKPPMHGLIIRQGSLIDRSRNEIVKLMLEHPAGFTHLFFVDSDMGLAPDVLRRLADHDKPIVGGLCFRRLPPFEPAAFCVGENGLQPIVLSQPTQMLQRVDVCGTACLLIKREVFEKLPYPWFAIRWQGDQQLGEDLSFGMACREAKIETWLDVSVQVSHASSGMVAWDAVNAKPYFHF